MAKKQPGKKAKQAPPKARPKKTPKARAARVVGKAGTISVPTPVPVKWRDLVPDDENPRFITDEEMASLRESIVVHGVVEALVVQKGTRKIIGGHQRVDALRQFESEGWTVPDEVPAYVLDVDDETAAQVNVGLNRIGGEFDAIKLGRLLAKHAGGNFNLLASGFRQEEVSELIRQATMTPEQMAKMLEGQVGDLTTFAKSVTLTVPFKTVAQRDEAKALFSKSGADDQGAFLLSLLKRNAAASKKSRR